MKQYFQDTFIIRYLDGSVKVVSEQEAYDEWDTRPWEQYWLSIASVSLIPGSKIGMG